MESNKRVQVNFFYKTEAVDEENNVMVTGGWGGGRIDWGVRTDICTLLFIKQIIRTYRVAQGTQYSVMSFMGKES